MHAFQSTEECIALLDGQVCLEGAALMVGVCGESGNQNACCVMLTPQDPSLLESVEVERTWGVEVCWAALLG